MLGRVAGPVGGGVSEQRQREAAFVFGGHTADTADVPSLPPPPPMTVPPKKLLLPAGCGVVTGEEALFSQPPELVGAGVVMVSPTSTLQAPVGSPATSPATTAVPLFSCRGPATSSSSGGDDRLLRSCKSRSQRPWEARPVGVGLAGALTNGDADADDLPPAATTLVLTTGQRMRRPCQNSSSSSFARCSSLESRSRCCRCVLLPREMMEASSEDYTRVITRGANPRTTHIFDDRVVVVEDDESFLRWCHGCSKDLGQGNDIFMYRGEMAFCSHECRYSEMVLDEQEESS